MFDEDKKKMSLLKLKKIVDKLHLYQDSKTAVMMLVSWIVSFLGIRALYGKLDQPKCAVSAEIASTFFIFSISVLSDFLIRKEKRSSFLSRLIYCIICTSFAFVAFVCIASFLGSEISLQCWDVVYLICEVFLFILGVDTVVLYLFSPYKEADMQDTELMNEDIKKRYTEQFEKSLRGSKND